MNSDRPPSPSKSGSSEHEFSTHRAWCFGIAYRMLGSVVDAEDIVQESWLRWQAQRDPILKPKAWLRKVITRLAIDRLRERQRITTPYPGPWLPEPLLEDTAQPNAALDVRLDAIDSINTTFLALLEALGPRERAVYLLRRVFECDYEEISTIVETSNEHARQIFARARKKFKAPIPQPRPTDEVQGRCLSQFYSAVTQGDLQALLRALDPDVELISDGGGKRSAAPKPLRGAERVAHFLLGIAKIQIRSGARTQFVMVNGNPGAKVLASDGLDSVVSYELKGSRIHRIFIVRNPDKLRHLGALTQRSK